MTEAHAPYDLLVVGGGINGVGIARDASGRGLRVLLCEQDDLANHTSSASTKLIHGGLRYLEHGEWRLVRKALAEREVLLQCAPHILWPLRFVLPHEPHLRPAWMIRAGLFLYDHLARRTTLPASETIDLSRHPAGLPLRHLTNTAFIYSDVWAEDTRLVVLNALDAHERGARILTRTRCVRITPSASNWHATLRDDAGHEETVTARCVVNAAGPWASEFLERRAPSGARHAIRLVKGSHIVIPRLYTHPDAYLFQNSDRRVVFAIPYEHEFTLIGTTDVDYQGNPAQATISPEETQYLCDVATRHFKRTVTPADVIWSYSGVRPLLKDESIDATTVTRDYEFEWTDTGPPLLSVFGGKLTTYRRLAEEALAEILSRLDRKASAWTARAVLPGGDLPGGDRTRFEDRLRQQYPHFKETLRQRWARTYGTRVEHWLGAATDTKRLGAEVLPDLFEAEIDYLRRIEWAKSATDILWRRTKLGLHLPPDATGRLDEWLRSHPLKPASISMT